MSDRNERVSLFNLENQFYFRRSSVGATFHKTLEERGRGSLVSVPRGCSRLRFDAEPLENLSNTTQREQRGEPGLERDRGNRGRRPRQPVVGGSFRKRNETA